MTENDFRLKHSELIEYYQLIEMRLKGICAAILSDSERCWFERLNDYESDNLGKLICKIKMLREQKKCEWFTAEDMECLDNLRLSRNYWCHQCFGGNYPVTFRKGVVRLSMHAARINSDLQNAIDWDEKLTAVFKQIPRCGGI